MIFRCCRSLWKINPFPLTDPINQYYLTKLQRIQKHCAIIVFSGWYCRINSFLLYNLCSLFFSLYLSLSSFHMNVCRTGISGMSTAGSKSMVMCSDPPVTLWSSPPWLAQVARSSQCPSLLSLWPCLRICTLSKSQGHLFLKHSSCSCSWVI